MLKKQDVIYIPDDTDKEPPKYTDKIRYNFTGLPCPTKGAVKEIGVEGVEAIDQKIKEMISWKVKLYGKNSHKIKFPSTIEFFDKNNLQSYIKCSPLIVHGGMQEKELRELKSKYHFPERVNWIMDNYKLDVLECTASIQNKISQILIGII